MIFIIKTKVEARQSEEELESFHPCNTNDDCIHQGPYTTCGCVFDDCQICIESGEEGVARSATEGMMSAVFIAAKF